MKRALQLILVPVVMIGGVILGQSSVKNPHGKLAWDCQDCHSTASWSDIKVSEKFDHAKTGFTLLGAHATAQCIGCHKDPVFSHVGVSCIDCHADHHNGQLGMDCQNCHTPRDWQNRRDLLDLHASRGFALTGVHAVADCEACHSGHPQQQYAGAPVDCYSCHAEAYAATTEPNHATSEFSIDCRECHQMTASSWHDASVIHPASFPLTGGHAGIPCRDCHTDGYANLSSDCYSCHSTQFAATTDPDHETASFSHDCRLCHTIVAWQPSFYDHNGTAFPLTGAHRQTACIQCHATQYAGTPTDCYSCHQSAFEQTLDPNHVTGNFDHNCIVCHGTTAWQPSTFDHNVTTFPLTGAHLTATCVSCHGSGFAGTPTACYSCHQTAFEQTLDPNHVTGNFDHNCSLCHTTTAWLPANFDHSTTSFPLTGKHVTAICLSCHASGFTGTPTNCYACHQTAYNGTTDPSHTAAGFPTSCENCHTTNGWTPANWDHDALYFPIYSGAHAGRWNTCADCHVNQSSFAVFECINCHEHNSTDMNAKHSQVQNYQYVSTACYSCHPRGRH